MKNLFSKVLGRRDFSSAVTNPIVNYIATSEVKKYNQVLTIRSCPTTETQSLYGISRVFFPGKATPDFSASGNGSIGLIPANSEEVFLCNLFSKSDIVLENNDLDERSFSVSGETIAHFLDKKNEILQTEISRNGTLIGIFSTKYDKSVEEKAKTNDLRYFVVRMEKNDKYYLDEIVDGKEVPAKFSQEVIHFDERTRKKSELSEQTEVLKERYEHYIKQKSNELSSYIPIKSKDSMLFSILSDIHIEALKTNKEYEKSFSDKMNEMKKDEKITVKKDDKPSSTIKNQDEIYNRLIDNERYSGSGFNMSAGGD